MRHQCESQPQMSDAPMSTNHDSDQPPQDGTPDRDHSRGYHGHGTHGHDHRSKQLGWALAVATALNVGLVVLQTAYGILAHSTALLADAGHNLGDALGLILAWGAHVMAGRRPTEGYTYGWRPASILAALLNAITLLIVTGAIAWEALQRWFAPAPVAAAQVMLVAAL